MCRARGRPELGEGRHGDREMLQDVDITPEAVRVSFAGFEVYPRQLDDAGLGELAKLMRSDMVEIDIDLGYG